jgi:hypothetical protein
LLLDDFPQIFGIQPAPAVLDVDLAFVIGLASTEFGIQPAKIAHDSNGSFFSYTQWTMYGFKSMDFQICVQNPMNTSLAVAHATTCAARSNSRARRIVPSGT